MSEMHGSDPVAAESPVHRAWSVALGRAAGREEAIEIIGAQNDYSSRGSGSTMARRVLRDGSWDWVSAPTSRGRYLAADRRDTQRGEVYEGEIVAQYTLGSARPRPDKFFLVAVDDKPLRKLDHAKVRGGYRLSRISVEADTLDVSDPTWR